MCTAHWAIALYCAWRMIDAVLACLESWLGLLPKVKHKLAHKVPTAVQVCRLCAASINFAAFLIMCG